MFAAFQHCYNLYYNLIKLFNVSSTAVAVALKQVVSPEFKEYQKQVVSNAKTMCQFLLDKGYHVVSGKCSVTLFKDILSL